MDIAVVGAGRVGTAIAVHLAKAGHRIVGVSGRDPSKERADRYLPGVPFLPPVEAVGAAGVVILGVPDDRITGICTDLAARGAFRARQSVLHLSGSASLDALAPASAGRARTLSLHPLQTFPDVEAAIRWLPGSAIAVTAADEKGFRVGERLAFDMGGRPFRLDDEKKPLYHAAAVFCSNYLATVEGIAERAFRAAGLEDPVSLFAPLANATLANVLELGPANALTGPAARGDEGTIRRNLQALAAATPEAVPVYVALATAAVGLAGEADRLSDAARARVEEVLGEWR